MENYKILNKIGSGSFAKVYLALHRPTGKQVALKVIKKKDISSEKLDQRLRREIKNMKMLRHDNIVEYLDDFETESELYIAMEYLAGGELFDYIADKQGLPESQARQIFSQIAAAVQHCHKNNISHRDLKLENILLTKDGKPKLVDFGFSKTTHDNPMLATYCGSTLYASPEMILGKHYLGPECDVWSLGVILFCMLTACMPFDDHGWEDFVWAIERADYPQPPGASENAKHLISRMLDPSSKTRATIDDVLNHPWFNPQPRKSSLQLPSKSKSFRTRRIGILHSQSAATEISKMMISEMSSTCVYECHSDKENESSCERKDSTLLPLHCGGHQTMLPMRTPKDAMYMHNIGKSTNSICSSGYSSSTDSLIASPLPVCSDYYDYTLSSPLLYNNRKSTATSIILSCTQSDFLDTDDEDEEVELVYA